jgi:hypothetical protein
MTLTEEITIERQIVGTCGANTGDSLRYALLLSGGLAAGIMQMTQTLPPLYNIQHIASRGTISLSIPDVTVRTAAELRENRQNLINRLRALRERSIQEGATLLTAEQISEQMRSMREN